MRSNIFTDTTLALNCLLDIGTAILHNKQGFWHIHYNPKPKPGHDWDWRHDDYDGAPDSGDKRCGSESTAEAALQAIEELNTSPLDGQPQGVKLATCIIRDTLGLVLTIGIPVLLVILAANYMELFE